jgi:hypothetical protein
MTDMTAFERQLSGEITGLMGPVRPVDDEAIFTAITAAQSPRWRFQSMFSAAKFVIAGVVLALFGGLLLAGVLTQQPSDETAPDAAASASIAPAATEPAATRNVQPEPDASASADVQAELRTLKNRLNHLRAKRAPTEADRAEIRALRNQIALLQDTTTPELLPGLDLVTEQIEPGAYRVLSDGVRELSGLPADERRYMGGVLDTNIAAGLDGSIWLFGLDGFYRLGADAKHQWFEDSWRDGNGRPGQADIEVGPGGTVWLQPADGGDIWSFDGESWATRREGSKDEVLSGLAVQQDGTVLTTWSTDPPGGKNKPQPRTTVARLGADGWEDLPGSVEGAGVVFHDVIVTDGGGEEVWLMPGFGPLRRHDGTGWIAQPTPKAGSEVRAAVGPDGTLWVRLVRCDSTTECEAGTAMNGRSSILARLDGEVWEVFRAKDGIPLMGDHYQGFEGFFEVAPDRSIWFNPNGDPRTGPECDGIANFDGQVLHHYLRGHCITAMDIASDGTVWLRATEREPDGSARPERRSFDFLPNEPVHTYAITREASTATES